VASGIGGRAADFHDGSVLLILSTGTRWEIFCGELVAGRKGAARIAGRRGAAGIA